MPFVIFGVFLAKSGVGKFFIDLTYSLVGRSQSGTAQVAVVGSALMGSISGSPVANVVATGNFTIPLMKSGLLSVATLIFCLKFRDLATSIMLYTAGNETIAVLIVEFIEDGHTGPLGALALLVLCINLTLVMTSKKLVGKGAFQM